jgi:photosystem II stability/assembly factor-like uncharacterized protein
VTIGQGEHYEQPIQTCDGGLSWHKWYVPGLFIIDGATFLSSSVGFAYGTGRTSYSESSYSLNGPAGLYRTVDGTKTWIKVSDQPVDHVAVVDESTYFVHFTGGYYKTKDSGQTWAFQTRESLPDRFLDENIAWRVEYIPWSDRQYRLEFTADGGKNWTEVFPDTVRNPSITAVFFLDYLTGWIGDSVGRVYRTEDAGQSWQLERDQLSKSVERITQIMFLNKNTGYMAFDSGGKPGHAAHYRRWAYLDLRWCLWG